jgi:hypothetical protein
MRAAAGTLLLSAACVLAGCGTSARDQVRAKVEQFVTAAAHHDYTTICDEVLAPSLIGRLSAAGVSCEQAMQIGFGGVVAPILSIARIDVKGSSASAITLTSARGQQASVDAIELVKTDHGWRVSSLGSPAQRVS